MSRRVRVHLIAAFGVKVGRCSQKACAESDRLLVAGGDVLNVQIEVHLLRFAIRPVGFDVVRSELEGDERLTVDVHGVPVILLEVNGSIDEGSPETALGFEIGSVEDDGMA